MQIRSKHALKVWRKAKCDPKVRYLITPLTAMANQQFLADHTELIKESKKEETHLELSFGTYIDEVARYGTLDIDGLFDKKKPFKIVKDNVSEFGMKTKVRDDCWELIPEVLKSELMDSVIALTKLSKKEIESLGFTVLSPGSDWKNAPDAVSKK